MSELADASGKSGTASCCYYCASPGKSRLNRCFVRPCRAAGHSAVAECLPFAPKTLLRCGGASDSPPVETQERGRAGGGGTAALVDLHETLIDAADCPESSNTSAPPPPPLQSRTSADTRLPNGVFSNGFSNFVFLSDLSRNGFEILRNMFYSTSIFE